MVLYSTRLVLADGPGDGVEARSENVPLRASATRRGGEHGRGGVVATVSSGLRLFDRRSDLARAKEAGLVLFLTPTAYHEH
jgi:hypothetical protein